MDEEDALTFMKVQLYEHLSKTETFASVFRISQVVFDAPEDGSFIQNMKTGSKWWRRQGDAFYYLDLWVKPASPFGRQGLTN